MRYAIEGNFNHDWLFEGLVYSFGGKVVSDDGKRALFNEAPAVRALTTLRDLARKDRILYVNQTSRRSSRTSWRAARR